MTIFAALSGAIVALSIAGAIVVGTVVFALLSVRHFSHDPQQYIVGGRSFGPLFLWVLLAGEIFTAFTFLGAAGWAYGRGAPAFYILAYGTIGFTIGYFLLPAVWRIGKERGLLTAPDFLADRFDSRALGIGVGVLQFVLVVPYVTLQLGGLQKLLSIAGYGAFNATSDVAVAFLLIAGFVFTAGLRGTAWASIVKDILVLGAAIFAGIAIPMQFFGSPGAMFDQIARAHPAWLTLAPGGADHGVVWFVSTVLLTSIGFYMGPHSIAATYSAKDEDALRRNAIFLPLYQLVLLLIFFAGFAALLIVPGLHDPDTSFLQVVQQYYPPWVMGFIAGAGSLAALVPACALLLGAASVFTKNVLGDGFGIATGDRARTMATRIAVAVIAILSLGLWISYNSTLVDLLLLYYNGVTQFMPGFVFALVWKRTSAWSIGAGIAGGLAIALILWHQQLGPWGMNSGFLALLANLAIVAIVTLLWPRDERTR